MVITEKCQSDIGSMLLDHLGRDSKARIITVIGGGGKTSLLYYLARQFQQSGLQVIVTTTTKLYRPNQIGHQLLLANTWGKCCQAVREARVSRDIITLAAGTWQQDRHKVTGLDPQWLDALAQAYPNTIFLVEGDGAAGKSLKGHLDYDPVIPQLTQIVIPVIGFDVLGQKLDQQYVHRPDRIGQLTGAVDQAVITKETIISLLFHGSGYLHNCPDSATVIPFLNKVDSKAKWRQALPLASAILTVGHHQFDGVIIGSVLQNNFWFYQKIETFL
ncbi:MAG TPA: selenium cofactor biosynthesis protein YqeC [Negativicutes bacterium]